MIIIILHVTVCENYVKQKLIDAIITVGERNSLPFYGNIEHKRQYNVFWIENFN